MNTNHVKIDNCIIALLIIFCLSFLGPGPGAGPPSGGGRAGPRPSPCRCVGAHKCGNHLKIWNTNENHVVWLWHMTLQNINSTKDFERCVAQNPKKRSILREPRFQKHWLAWEIRTCMSQLHGKNNVSVYVENQTPLMSRASVTQDLKTSICYAKS